MSNPTCPQCDCVAGCQARERLCPNVVVPDVTFIDEGNKAVMQQALDTLKRVDCVDRDCDILSLSLCEAVEESIAALGKAVAQPAIAQPVQQATQNVAYICQGCGGIYWAKVDCDCNKKAAFDLVAVSNIAQPIQSKPTL